MNTPTPEQCEAVAAAAEEARKANYWSTADPYLILLVGVLMLTPFLIAWWQTRRSSPGEPQP